MNCIEFGYNRNTGEFYTGDFSKFGYTPFMIDVGSVTQYAHPDIFEILGYPPTIESWSRFVVANLYLGDLSEEQFNRLMQAMRAFYLSLGCDVDDTYEYERSRINFWVYDVEPIIVDDKRYQADFHGDDREKITKKAFDLGIIEEEKIPT